MRLKPSLIHVCDVTPQQRRQMLALMQRYYENVTESNFTADLAEKRWVILLSDPRADEICGFSTQGLFTVNIQNRTVTALFSGDRSTGW